MEPLNLRMVQVLIAKGVVVIHTDPLPLQLKGKYLLEVFDGFRYFATQGSPAIPYLGDF